VRLLLDEMWPPSLAEQLRRRGHDVIGVTERSDLRTRLDPEIFEAAQTEGLTIVTENAPDFRRIVMKHLLRGQSHAGLIYTTDRQFPRNDPRTLGRMVTALNTLLSTHTQLDDIEYWLPPPP
jgi:hypothetical protein